MNRKLLIIVHMYLSSFFAPFVFLVAISGGLYLLGIKGSVSEQLIYSAAGQLDPASGSLDTDVSRLLLDAGVVDYEFEYVKVKGSTLYTRPTSRDHYVIKLGDGELEVIAVQPSLQNALVELHKGHGPGIFKTFQSVFALGLLCIVGAGLWLGLSASALQQRTLMTSLAGTAVFLLLVLA